MNFKKLLSLVMAIVIVLGVASFSASSADSTHSRLTHLTGEALIETNVPVRSFSDLDRLFDGDSSASHADTVPAQVPDGNGLFGDQWHGAGERNYIIVDLGDIYELSQMKTYWGWAPQAQPTWNTWEYDVPSSYEIYISETKEGLETAEPAQTVTGLSKNSSYIANSTATFSATGRYVKIVSTCVSGHYALREIEFYGARKPAVNALGASIRLESEGVVPGLRFGAKVDKTVLGIEGDWSYGDDSDIEFGMYVIPKDQLSADTTLVDFLNGGGQETALKIPARKILSQDETQIVYSTVLVGITEENFNRKIAAVPYVIKGGETTYFDEMSKSYLDVAVAAINSYENGNPNNITSDQYDALKLIVGDTEEEEEPSVPVGPHALITGIQVSGTTISSMFPDTRPLSIIVNGVNGEGTMSDSVIWGDELFITNEVYDVGDGTSTLFSLTFNLGKKYEVSRFFLGIGWDSAGIVSADLLGSNDGATWTPVATGLATGSYWETFQGGYAIISELSNVTYQYFRFDVKKLSASTNVQIFEAQFTGAPMGSDGGEEPAPPEDIVYYDIDAAAQAKGYRNNSILPASLFVPLGTTYGGYKIDGTYRLDADTLRMLTTVPCTGNGTVKYKDYNNFSEYIADKSYGVGYGPHCYGEQIVSAPVSKLSDPIYMSMALPSEGTTYQNVLHPSDPRNNGNNLHAVCTVSGCTRCNKVEYIRLNALGAFYLNQDKKDELSNYKDVQFKLCLGNIRLFVNTASGGWQQVKVDATPTSGNGYLYCLPWALEWNSATSKTYLDSCKSLTNVSRKTNYSEIPLTVGDFFFTKTFTGTDGKSYSIDERVLHFWGSQYNIANDDAILGIIASYDMWIEYDESIGIKLEDYFISSIGADWRYSNGSGGYITRQAFAGYKHAVSTEKITVYGHNLTPSNYDSLMPSTAITFFKNTLGIK